MSEEFRAKVFKSGNSVALRLPKALGVAEGTEMVVREEGGKFTFEPVPTKTDRIDLTGIWGSVPDIRSVGRIELGERELDWTRKPQLG